MDLWSIEAYGPLYEVASEVYQEPKYALLGARRFAGPCDVASEVYQEPKYAWPLNRMYEQRTKSRPAQDTWCHPRSWLGSRYPNHAWYFVYIGTEELPAGSFSLDEDAKIGFSGRHVKGCSLFPCAGFAILRGDTAGGQGPSINMFYGPHSAGRQHACALHFSLYACGHKLLVDGAVYPYSAPRHLTWSNQTIAHNTVVVDQTSMFPTLDHEEHWYQFDADTYYFGPETDGVLECFYPGEELQVVRATNCAVYNGVILDRTIAVIAGKYVVDIFRVSSAETHTYDLAVHGIGKIDSAAKQLSATDLGDRIVYRHLQSARVMNADPPWELTWDFHKVHLTGRFYCPTPSELFIAADLTGDDTEERTVAIIRTEAGSTLFVSLFDPWELRPHVDAVQFEVAGANSVVLLRVDRGETREVLLAPRVNQQHESASQGDEPALALLRLVNSVFTPIESASRFE